VIIAVKGQDTHRALEALAPAAPAEVTVVCAQNGVDNERQALRRFAGVYALCVMLPATMLEPALVRLHGAPRPGILDLGRYPSGVDDTAASIAADLRSAGFASEPVEQPMRLKYAKLLMNLGNALDAACGPIEGGSEILRRSRAEAEACFRAAGIDWASDEEDRDRRRGVMEIPPAELRHRLGGSTWQSLARGARAVEADALNGEIVLMGRLHGVPTPANELLRQTVNAMAASGAPPGSVPMTTLLARLEQMTA
jgi:2-dehydropantoate 2-reductase